MLLRRFQNASFPRSLILAVKRRRGLATAHAAMVAGQPMRYKLGKTATLELTRGDLTRFDGDAIVNAGK